MIVFLHLFALTCNCILVHSSFLPSKEEVLRDPQDLEYVLKRHDREETDSKERRSNLGSSFIRYGRNDNEIESEILENEESKVNRTPRRKSPDIVIRFGRSGFKVEENKRGNGGLNFIRYGRNVRVYPIDLEFSGLCSEEEMLRKNLRPSILSRLRRLCSLLTETIQESEEDEEDGRKD